MKKNIEGTCLVDSEFSLPLSHTLYIETIDHLNRPIWRNEFHHSELIQANELNNYLHTKPNQLHHNKHKHKHIHMYTVSFTLNMTLWLSFVL